MSPGVGFPSTFRGIFSSGDDPLVSRGWGFHSFARGVRVFFRFFFVHRTKQLPPLAEEAEGVCVVVNKNTETKRNETKQNPSILGWKINVVSLRRTGTQRTL